VLGGGFAGSQVARELGTSGATIVDPAPLRTPSPHAEVILGSAVGLDSRRRVAQVESEPGRIGVAYAELVVAVGAAARDLGRLGLPLDSDGRVAVDWTLRVPGALNIWALGDCAAVPTAETCQHPVCQARRLAHHLRPERTHA
jgi:NADH dehydrogenase FAD-containing subunit